VNRPSQGTAQRNSIIKIIPRVGFELTTTLAFDRARGATGQTYRNWKKKSERCYTT